MTLDPRFILPKSLQYGSFVNDAGRVIRCAAVDPEGAPVARVIICEGFREPFEKWGEVINEKRAQGVQVFAFDWPGQGTSRFLPEEPMKSHHLGYAESIETLLRFLRLHVGPSALPTFIIAHSMGGHIVLRAAAENKIDAALICSSAMVEPDFIVPKFVARCAVAFARAVGKLENYAPFAGGPWSPDKDVFEGNAKTSDQERFTVQTEIYKANPLLQMGGPTYGWVYETLRSVAILRRPEYLRRIENDVLMAVCGRDRIVSNKALRRACSLLPHCEVFDMAAARHESWMERNELRDPWRLRADGFMEQRMRGAKLWSAPQLGG